MIIYYFKSAFRYLQSNKIISTLNILGLSVTFVVFILLGSYVSNEMNMGKNLPNYSTIYRVQPQNGASLSYKTLQLLKNIPEVSNYTFLMNSWGKNRYFARNNNVYDPGKILFASKDFFKVFPYRAVNGNAEHFKSDPNSIVITESLARKIFGNQNPIGKNLIYKSTAFGSFDYHVVAVIKDLPQNDMLKFTCILPEWSLDKMSWFKDYKESWGNCSFETFATFPKNASIQSATEKLNTRFKKEAPDWLVKDNKSLSMQPFKSLYINNAFPDNILEQNSKSNLRTMGLLTLIILLAGAINFINLSTAQKEKKRKTLAICRINGASRGSIYKQFFAESFLVILISMTLAILLLVIAYPLFDRLSGQSFSYVFFLQFLFVKNYWIIPVALAVVCGFTIAVYFQSGKFDLMQKSKKRSKERFRNTLLVIQFVVSIILIAGTIIIQKQNRFMLNHSTGFQKGGIICIPLIDELHNHTPALRNKLLRIPGVSDIAFASTILGQEDMTWGRSITNHGETKRVEYDVIQVDSAFFNLMGLKIIQGTGFNASSGKEMDHIFNQTALKKFGITNIHQARVSSFSTAPGNIIGVVKDFNFRSLHSPIKPMAFVYRSPGQLNYAYLKLSDLSATGIKRVIGKAGEVWKQFAPDWPFEYQFLDQSMAKLYERDINFGKISFALTVLAVFIACFGLLGITLSQVELKIKEIGIRKVNGAKVSEIVFMLNKDFVKWVIVAFVIATPIAYYTLRRWLENFAYKTHLSWWIFVLAGIAVLVIALATVSWQTFIVARKNPVEALRYE